MEEIKDSIDASELTKKLNAMNSRRIDQIREIIQNNLFSDKSKIYEIKRVLNIAMIDFLKTQRKTDATKASFEWIFCK